MAQTTGRNLPPPQAPFVKPERTLSDEGYQYLLSLLATASSAIATSTVDTGLVATGSNQATALQLSAQWNEVSTVPLASGVLLQALQPGQSQTVFNHGANALNIYPPPGMQIDALDVNLAYALAAGSRHTFDFLSAVQIRS